MLFYGRYSSMKSLSFIHIADLHLDTAFSTIANDDKEQLTKRMQNAPFEALKNLLQLCRSLSPNFLIFSGDIYNKEEASLRARFALRDAFEELQQMNIPVYYAHGNHDPLNNDAKTEFKSVEWPSNVYFFGENWEYFSFPPPNIETQETNEHHELARVYGISHTCKHETKNLTSLLQVATTSCVKIGVLHTSLTGVHAKNQQKYSYAPCSISDLQEKNMHYWALGHVHLPNIISENPLIAYAGSTQGLDITETGAHGCMFVQFKNIEGTHISNPEYSFHPLAPVEWHIIDINLDSKKDTDEPENILEVQKFIAKSIESYIKNLTLETKCTDLIFRIRLYGTSDLANHLHEKNVQNDLCQALQKINIIPNIFVKDIQSFVRPTFDFESALNRDDILGEILRVTQNLRDNDDVLIQTEREISELLKAKVLRCTTNIIEKNNDSISKEENTIENLKALTYKAEEICIEVFEPQQ